MAAAENRQYLLRQSIQARLLTELMHAGVSGEGKPEAAGCAGGACRDERCMP